MRFICWHFLHYQFRKKSVLCNHVFPHYMHNTSFDIWLCWVDWIFICILLCFSGLCLELQVPECRALGHTSVSFPNMFQQNSIDAALEYFNIYKNQTCSTSSMYYLCNLFFPKCDPSSGSIKYACQDHCYSMYTLFFLWDVRF